MSPRATPDQLPSDDPRFTAAIDLIRRTGGREIQIRWSDDEEPMVWMVTVRHQVGSDGLPVADGGATHWEGAAAMHPTTAMFRLCDTLVDGGHCKHCLRPTGFTEELGPMPLDAQVCWYQYDPELKTFRRGCEGDDR